MKGYDSNYFPPNNLVNLFSKDLHYEAYKKLFCSNKWGAIAEHENTEAEGIIAEEFFDGKVKIEEYKNRFFKGDDFLGKQFQ